MDKEYWETYYANQRTTDQPSDFARFCAKKYSSKFGQFFDIGCGNGRDTLFFSSQNIPCIGIDQSQQAITKNNEKKKQLDLPAQFHIGDFSNFDYDSVSKDLFSVYSRFTLHAINYEEETRLFDHINRSKNLAYLFIEARSIKDALYGSGTKVGLHEYVSTHYRRFIDPVVLKSKLEKTFDIEYFEESQGFAKTETEDPCLIRLIAKKR
jgi:ubiquinone/menaquinone biosynthesis C-methylase UbiE